MRKLKIITAATLLTLGLSVSGLAAADNMSLTPIQGQSSSDQTSDASDLQNAQSQEELFGQPNSQDKAVFNSVSRQAMPMTPDEIVKMHKMLDMTQKAAAASAVTPPQPVTTTRMVSLQPGALPPVVRLSQGFVSSLVFVDSTGQPWPIESYDIGNTQAFNIQPPQKGGNALMIQANSPYTYGNMAVKLQGMSTPIMLTLIPGQKEVDYRADLHIEAEGPNAKTIPGASTLPAQANDVLLTVLNGVSPQGSKLVQVSDGESQAWVVGDRLYLRTKQTILSPGWMAMMSSADGTKAYEMQKTPNVLVSE